MREFVLEIQSPKTPRVQESGRFSTVGRALGALRAINKKVPYASPIDYMGDTASFTNDQGKLYQVREVQYA